jgi:anaerobic selenocysteine-containing dehydrogenase
MMSEGPISPDGSTASVAAALRDAKRPGLLVGSDLVDGDALGAAVQIARALKGGGGRFGTLFPGPNAFGSAILSREAGLPGILTGLENGAFDAAVIVESETSSWSPRARQALDRVPLLIVLDYLPGSLADRAHVLFPTTATYESNGVYVNRAGRFQAFAQVRTPGLSIIDEIHDGSFPRTPRRTPLEGDARMAWWVLDALRERIDGKPAHRGVYEMRDAMAREHRVFRSLRNVRAGDDGAPITLSELETSAASLPTFDRPSGLSLFRMDRTLGSEVLSRRGKPMQAMAGPPSAWLSPADAEKLSVRGRVVIDAGGSAVELHARPTASVPEGVVVVPRDVEWPITPRQGASVRVAATKAEEAVR